MEEGCREQGCRAYGWGGLNGSCPSVHTVQVYILSRCIFFLPDVESTWVLLIELLWLESADWALLALSAHLSAQRAQRGVEPQSREGSERLLAPRVITQPEHIVDSMDAGQETRGEASADEDDTRALPREAWLASKQTQQLSMEAHEMVANGMRCHWGDF